MNQITLINPLFNQPVNISPDITSLNHVFKSVHTNYIFSLGKMSYCQPWLDCNAIEDQIKLTQKDVGNGLGKMFSKAELDGMKVAFIRTREDKLTSGELSKQSKDS